MDTKKNEESTDLTFQMGERQLEKLTNFLRKLSGKTTEVDALEELKTYLDDAKEQVQELEGRVMHYMHKSLFLNIEVKRLRRILINLKIDPDEGISQKIEDTRLCFCRYCTPPER